MNGKLADYTPAQLCTLAEAEKAKNPQDWAQRLARKLGVTRAGLHQKMRRAKQYESQRLTPIMRANIYVARQNGVSVKSLCAKYGITGGTVYRWSKGDGADAARETAAHLGMLESHAFCT